MRRTLRQYGFAMGLGIMAAITPVVAVTSGAFFSIVEPVLFPDWQVGNAYFECAQANSDCEFAWKIDNSAEDGQYYTDTTQFGNTPTDFRATITISNSTVTGMGQTFDWEMDYPVCAVIVKGGPQANVYYYPPNTYSDQGLHSPLNNNSSRYFDVSHVTFCFDDHDMEFCYQEETAWAIGSRYTQRGSWAMFTEYESQATEVPIRAGGGNGIGLDAGTVYISEPFEGMVEMTIQLNDGFVFYYDPSDDNVDDNIKIQDYESAPSGNPKVGLFDWKAQASVGSTSYTLIVPENNYYGIHLDVAVQIPCN